MEDVIENICEQANELITNLDQYGVPFEFIQYISACITDNESCDLEGYKEFLRENC